MRILRLIPFLVLSLLPNSSGAARLEVLGNVSFPYAMQNTQISDDGNTVLVPSSGDGRTSIVLWKSSSGVQQTFSPHFGFSPLGMSSNGMHLVGYYQESQTREVDASFDGSVVVGTRGAKGYRRISGGQPIEFNHRPNEGFEVAPNAVSSDGKAIVGAVWGPNHNEPFRWTAEEGLVTLGMLPGVTIARGNAKDVSADGNVVVGLVGSRHEFGLNEAFVWTPTVGLRSLHPVGLLDQTVAVAVSADGKTIVGQSFKRGRDDEAVLWDRDYNLRSIAAILSEDLAVDMRGISLRSATGVSADGRFVVGWGVANRSAFIWRANLSPVPEASSFVTAILAMIFGAVLRPGRRVPRPA